MVESPTVKAFKRQDCRLGIWLSGGLGSAELTLDLVLVEVFTNLNDSMSL